MAQTPVLRRVACACFDTYVETHFRNRCFEVALHVYRERLERRDVERMQTRFTLWGFAQADEARQEASKRFTCARRRNQQGAAMCKRKVEQSQLMRTRAPAPIREPGHKCGRQRARGRYCVSFFAVFAFCAGVLFAHGWTINRVVPPRSTQGTDPDKIRRCQPMLRRD